ncbi:MAG: S24/S26 family peptidase [Acidobacteria bacterium]|nr:S24/S26 family peptidase [Acidobacteriota bacterium]
MRTADALRAFLEDGDVTVTVKGLSMSPAFAPGQRVTVSRRRFLLPGDVAVFALDGQLVVHRVLGIHPFRGRLLAQGDAAPRADRLVPLADVLGAVRTPVPLRTRARALARGLRLALGAAFA